MATGLIRVLLLLGLVVTPARAEDSLVDTVISSVVREDLDGLLKRREIRAVVAWSRTDYYLDRGRPRGVAYDSMMEFERWINQRHGRRLRPIRVLIIPVPRDALISALEDGRADIAVASLTITPERSRRIAFSEPIYSGAREVVVSERLSLLVPDRLALAGAELFVRASSSYAASLRKLNGEFLATGKPLMRVRDADEHLEDEDILDLVNAGIVSRTVVDDYKARLWDEVYPDIRIEQATVREGAVLAWGLRPGAPNLKQEVDEFVRSHRIGTEFGNVVFRRYYGNPERIRKPLDMHGLDRYRDVIDLFRKYGEQYDFDPLLLIAQAYQESGLDQNARSRAGAVGIMQLMPRTGKAMKVGDIHKIEPNIHAGTKYLRQIADTWLGEPDIDSFNRTLLAFAAYNAGPGNLTRARRMAMQRNLDPNVWFHNVEYTMGELLGMEPVRYVGNISKYYLAYRLLYQQNARRTDARERAGAAPVLP